MTNNTKISNAWASQSFKMLRAMVGIAVVCAFLIAFTYESTLERIEYNKAQALERAIFEVIDGIDSKESYSYDGKQFVITSDEQSQGSKLYAGYDKDGNLKGIAIPASGLGFADIIKILYAYDPYKEEIIGFKVLESKETPGLGDKIEKDARFVRNFEDLSVQLDKQNFELINQVRTVKQGQKNNAWEIDGITGATISSKAIGDIIAKSSAEWIPGVYNRIKDFEIVDSRTNE